MRTVLCYLISIYTLILFIRILTSWFPPPMSGPLRTIWRILYDLTDPVLRPLRGLIPAVRFGGMAMDLSPILLFVILGVLRSVICR
jgi:YggT family protein